MSRERESQGKCWFDKRKRGLGVRLVTRVNEVILRHVQPRINEHHLLHEMLNRNDL